MMKFIIFTTIVCIFHVFAQETEIVTEPAGTILTTSAPPASVADTPPAPEIFDETEAQEDEFYDPEEEELEDEVLIDHEDDHDDHDVEDEEGESVSLRERIEEILPLDGIDTGLLVNEVAERIGDIQLPLSRALGKKKKSSGGYYPTYRTYYPVYTTGKKQSGYRVASYGKGKGKKSGSKGKGKGKGKKSGNYYGYGYGSAGYYGSGYNRYPYSYYGNRYPYRAGYYGRYY